MAASNCASVQCSGNPDEFRDCDRLIIREIIVQIVTRHGLKLAVGFEHFKAWSYSVFEDRVVVTDLRDIGKVVLRKAAKN